MLYLVTYDVPSTDNTTRDRISHALAAAGLVRVQYSVFWGFMSRNQAESIALKVQQILGPVEGDVRVVPICKKCRSRLLHVTVAVAGGKAAIARGTTTINTKFLSRAAKALIGKGGPAVPVPVPVAPGITPNVNISTPDPAPGSDTTQRVPGVPTSDNFDIEVLTAKKTSISAIDSSTGDSGPSSPVDSPLSVPTQPFSSQITASSPPGGSAPLANPAGNPKKPFLLI